MRLKIIKYVVYVSLAIAIVALIYFRAMDFAHCKFASYDLKRPTDFRLLTGNCVTTDKNGGTTYIKNLRGIGSDNTSADVNP